jgi:hypothetical protein
MKDVNKKVYPLNVYLVHLACLVAKPKTFTSGNRHWLLCGQGGYLKDYWKQNRHCNSTQLKWRMAHT